MKKVLLRGVAAGSGLFALAALPQAVMAAPTLAGTTVTNTASIAYQVNSVVQTPVTGAAQFDVDRKVIMTVTADNTPVQVVPSQSQVALGFTLTNLSNSNLDFVLTAANVIDGVEVSTGLDDNNSATNDIASAFTYYLDVNGDGVLDVGDTVLVGGRINNLMGEYGVNTAGSVKILVVADIPAGSVNNDIIGVVLKATAHDLVADGGAALVNSTANPDVPTGIQNVFADHYGEVGGVAVTGDVQYDGAYSMYGAYQVRTVELTLTKTARPIWDPINLFGNGTTIFPKAIPGAVVEYCLRVENPGALTATNLVVSDVLPATTTYYAGTATPTLATALQNVTTGAHATTCGDAAGQHGTSYGSFNPSLPVSSKGTVTADFSQLPAVNLAPSGTPLWVRFHVIVD